MQSRASLGKLAETLQGVPVWGCLPGSVAKEAGIRYGDVVMQVNGQRTRDIDEYLAARELRDDGADIVVFRDGVERTVQLVFRMRQPAEQTPDRLVEEVVRERLIPIEITDTKSADPSSTN